MVFKIDTKEKFTVITPMCETLSDNLTAELFSPGLFLEDPPALSLPRRGLSCVSRPNPLTILFPIPILWGQVCPVFRPAARDAITYNCGYDG